MQKMELACKKQVNSWLGVMHPASNMHMKPEVDAGNIIAVKRFPIFDGDKIETVIERTYDNLIV